MYGPEVWIDLAGAEWTYWDLWFSVVCVADYKGDWEELDREHYTDTRAVGTAMQERMWSHVVALKDRLTAAGITASELAGELIDDRKTLTKARSKVLRPESIDERHLSPAMRDTPRHRYKVRAHFGYWDLYPVSPKPFYDQLAKATSFDLEKPGWGLRTLGNVAPLFVALDRLETEHTADLPTLLAIRRAGLTASSLAHHRCNDSDGELSEYTTTATLRFSRTDWRATGIDPKTFWHDIFEIFGVLGNFGVTFEHENELMANLGANRDRALLLHVAEELEALYLADRLNEPVRQVKQFMRSSRKARQAPCL